MQTDQPLHFDPHPNGFKLFFMESRLEPDEQLHIMRPTQVRDERPDLIDPDNDLKASPSAIEEVAQVLAD